MQGRPAAEACPRLNGEKKLHGTLNICKVAAQLQLAVLALVGSGAYALNSAVITEALEAAVDGVVIVIAIGICQLLAGEHIGQALEGEGCAHNS